MPRTKVRKQNTVKSTLEDDNLSGAKKRLAELRKDVLDRIQIQRTTILEQLEVKFISEKMSIVKKYNNMTLAELANLKSFSSLSSSCLSGEDLVNITKPQKTYKRSSSCAGDDEGKKDGGYNTTESTNSGPRVSRSRAKKTTQKSRMTRSLSRNLQPPVATTSSQATPTNKTAPNSYGMITPKVKPNTPLVLLRRPKMGEVALSMQGSPLLTAAVVTDQTANINIPLVDGTLLSLQAQRGLRKSQIPDLDPDVKRQLALLRENLNLIV